MSKVLQQSTQYLDMDILRQAVEAYGFTAVYNDGYELRQFDGYRGQTFKANVGITRENFMKVTGQHTYGDLGFVTKADGTIGLIGDDLLIQAERFTKINEKLAKLYGEKKYVKTMYESNYQLASRQELPNGDIELQFAPMEGY